MESAAAVREQPAVQSWARSPTMVAVGVLAAALPLVGFVSLLLRSQLDPHFENYRLHFVVFGVVGAVAFILGYAAGEAANRRGDARVLLLSLAFMATGGFLGIHALGTPEVLFSRDYAGFQVAIPVGLLVAAAPYRSAAERHPRAFSMNERKVVSRNRPSDRRALAPARSIAALSAALPVL